MPYFTGTIQSFGYDYCPEGWLPCQGQVVQIQQFVELYSLIYTRFGGDGRVTFGIPDLRGRGSMGFGQGPGLTWRNIGNMPGIEHMPLSLEQMPVHSHPGTMTGTETKLKCATGDGTIDSPVGSSIAKVNRVKQFADVVPGQDMKAGSIELGGTVTVGDTGASQYHDNTQPCLVVNYCICCNGIYPRRS